MGKKILIAPNAFKHSLSAIEVAQTIKSAIDSLKIDVKCELVPIADGGDGTIDVIHFYFKKSKYIECNAHDPLMRIIKSKWLLFDKETAVIELSKASGIALLKDNELNPMWANTYGTGELILDALNNGCKKIILTLGGSATIDAGVGILQALGVRFYDKDKKLLKAGGSILSSIQDINLGNLDKRIKDCSLYLLCDVKIPLIGEKGTVARFGSQKGAKEGEIVIIENGMKHYAEVVKSFTKCDYSLESMVGSAGGVAFSLKALLGAELSSGFTYLANLIDLEEKIKSSDVVISGEGFLDSQTLMGKGVYELAKLLEKYKKGVIVLCGKYDKQINWNSYNVSQVIEISSEGLSLAESLKNAKELLQNAIKSNYKLFIN